MREYCSNLNRYRLWTCTFDLEVGLSKFVSKDFESLTHVPGSPNVPTVLRVVTSNAPF